MFGFISTVLQAAKEQYKRNATGELIAALIQYRESAKAAGRYPLSEWAHVTLARVVAYSHVSEDLRLQEAIAAFHKSGAATVNFGEELLRGFRTTLRDDELERLTDATAPVN